MSNIYIIPNVILIRNEYQITLKKNMNEENTTQEFPLKNKDEERNHFIEEMNQNDLINEKHKIICTTLDYIEPWLILVSGITGCVSVSAFTSLVGILLSIASQ